MAEDTWKTQEQPILEAVRAGESSGQLLDSASAGAAAGLDETASGWAVQALVESGFLVGIPTDSGADAFAGYFNLRLTEKGRQWVGQWPHDPDPEAFLAALDRLIDAEPDDEKRSRLQRARSALGGLGRDVLVEVIVTVGKWVATGTI